MLPAMASAPHVFGGAGAVLAAAAFHTDPVLSPFGACHWILPTSTAADVVEVAVEYSPPIEPAVHRWPQTVRPLFAVALP